MQLARKSTEVSGYDMVVFAGVKFMAEMASVLSPTPVYIPDPKALCPLAGYLDAQKISEKKKEYWYGINWNGNIIDRIAPTNDEAILMFQEMVGMPWSKCKQMNCEVIKVPITRDERGFIKRL